MCINLLFQNAVLYSTSHDRLYSIAHLVHGDLSEYNILVAPAATLRNRLDALSEEDTDELQVVFIDFGQAVDYKHPGALELLDRDIDRVNKFFETQGVEVMSHQAMINMITKENDDDDEIEVKVTDLVN